MPEITAHELRTRRRAIALWALGLVATVLLYLLFYPAIRDSGEAYERAIEGLPDALQRLAGGSGDIASPEGYMQGQFFASFGFILLLAMAVGRGSRAIAGEEQEGLLELVLAAPVTRARIVLERALGLVLELLIMGLAIFLAILVLGPLFDLSIPAGRLAGATLSAAAGAIVFGLATLAAGAASGRRGVALGVGATLATAGFLYTTLSPISDSLAGRQAFSPCWQAFGYDPLSNGLDAGRLAVLIAEALVLVALAVWAFGRRDTR